MKDQGQSVENGSTAIQSGRDTIINGPSIEEIRSIVEGNASQITAFAAIAREIVESRLVEFEKRIVSRFDTDQSCNRNAFSDPDFQYIISQAQKFHARSGEILSADLLIDLIAERSKASDRDRLSLTLNLAVETVANLTVNEFAELAVCYIFTRTQSYPSTFKEFCVQLCNNINPYIDDISKNSSSYEFLEAQRCASVSVLENNFFDILINKYSAFFSQGFEESDIFRISTKLIPLDPNLFIYCLHNPSKIQLKSLNSKVWDNIADESIISSGLKEELWNLSQSKLMGHDEASNCLMPLVPRIRDMSQIWDCSPLRQLHLTAVGTAIAHSYASSHGFKADLSIWIN